MTASMAVSNLRDSFEERLTSISEKVDRIAENLIVATDQVDHNKQR